MPTGTPSTETHADMWVYWNIKYPIAFSTKVFSSFVTPDGSPNRIYWVKSWKWLDTARLTATDISQPSTISSGIVALGY